MTQTMRARLDMTTKQRVARQVRLVSSFLTCVLCHILYIITLTNHAHQQYIITKTNNNTETDPEKNEGMNVDDKDSEKRQAS